MSPGTLQMSAEVDITPTKEEITRGATTLGISGIAASNDSRPKSEGHWQEPRGRKIETLREQHCRNESDSKRWQRAPE